MNLPKKSHSSHSAFLAPLLLAMLTMLILARCGSSPTDPQPSPGTFGSVYSTFRSHNCNECHTPTGSATVTNQVQLDFTSQTTAYATLIGTQVHGGSSVGTCGSVKLVSPGNPSKSYLAAVLFSSYSSSDFAGVTGCQPYNAHQSQFNISSSDQSSIIDWIKNGALNN